MYGDTLPGDMSRAVAGVPERVYVPNSESASVDVIDPRTYRVIAHYPVGQYPQHITPSWNLRWLYVNNTDSNTLTVIDPRTGRPTGKVIPVTDPYNLYFTPDGQKAIVVAEAYQRLDFYNARTWRFLKSAVIPAVGPDHVDFSADGRSLVVSAEFSGWVIRVSTTSMRVTGRCYVGGLPIDVKLAPDGKVFYVANQGLGGVTILDARTLRRIGFLATGEGAHGLAVSRDTARGRQPGHDPGDPRRESSVGVQPVQRLGLSDQHPNRKSPARHQRRLKPARAVPVPPTRTDFARP